MNNRPWRCLGLAALSAIWALSCYAEPAAGIKVTEEAVLASSEHGLMKAASAAIDLPTQLVPSLPGAEKYFAIPQHPALLIAMLAVFTLLGGRQLFGRSRPSK